MLDLLDHDLKEIIILSGKVAPILKIQMKMLTSISHRIITRFK